MNWKTILAAGAILFSSTLYAQTPNGDTPANESVFGDLVSASPTQPQRPQLQSVELSQTLGQRVETGEVPDGLSNGDWASIQAQVAAGKYRAYQHPNDGFVSSNPAHGWQIRYGADGTTTLRPRDREAQAYYLGLRLSALGFAGRQTLDRPQRITADDFTVTYQWTDDLREWWVNTDSGLEQWFELEHRPSGVQSGQPLTLEVTLETDLAASQSGNALSFVNDAGTTISYNKLSAWDADGRDLPAHMQLVANRLSLIIDDTKASYPLTIDPNFQQQAYLKASNTDADDRFGYSVAISGDTLVVGAILEDSNATGVNGDQSDNSAIYSGAAYVFTRSGTTWSQQAYLKASNTDGATGNPNFYGDFFGYSVAISGDTVVVGAPYEDSNATGINGDQSDNSAGDSGAAYVFTRSGTTWSQQAYLKASNTHYAQFPDRFGWSVAISGDTLVVGAPFEGSNATGINGNQTDNSQGYSGAAYVFTRSGTAWSQQAYVKASNTDATDRFGWSLAIAGDTLVVGANYERSNATGINGNQSDNSAIESGAAYVFTRSGTVWSQQAYLKASNTDAYDYFGHSVAISGDTLVVSSQFESSNATGVNGDQSDNSVLYAGAAYVFTRSGTAWSQQAYLKASNTDAEDQFGQSVAIAGDTVVVGAHGEDSIATGINGDQTDNSGSHPGAAYVFTRSGTTWSQQTYLKASNNGGTRDWFGWSMAIAGDTLVVGAQLEDSNATGVDGDQSNDLAGYSGAAYVFDLYFTIGGNVSGLAGSGLVLQNNGGNDLPVSAEGGFTFNTPLDDGSAYNVTVLTQPGSPSQTCSVSNGSGTLAGADVSNIAVTCVTDTFSIGGNVSGLAGTGLVLQNNAGDDLAISADGSFTFTTELVDGSGYAVTVLTQPTNLSQTCGITNSSGTLAGADVNNVAVTCVTDTFSIGGNVSGLAGSGLVLQNNGGDDLAISADGSFTFATELVDGSGYAVTVLTQPTNLSQTCSITNGSGTLAGADVTDVAVTCVTDTFSIGGNVSGLAGTGLVLQNNAGDDLAISADGSFTFATELVDGSGYAVTVLTQPSGPHQICSVSNSSGTIAGADISNVTVTCATDAFSIGGNVSGLAGSGLVLQNSAGDDLAISADGSFTFATELGDGNTYAVTVLTQPTNLSQTCSITNGSGTLAGADVSNIAVTCVTDTFSIGGNVNGLAGSGLVLQNNAGDDLAISTDGSFTFATPLDDGSGYAVTVLTQPSGPHQICSVSNSSGTIAGANISNVTATCANEIIFVDGFED